MSLPREVRDMVYEEFIISSQPIVFNPVSGPIVNDIDRSLFWKTQCLAQVSFEALQIFYLRNVFVIFDEDLPMFLNSKLSSWMLRDSPESFCMERSSSEHNISACVARVEIFQEPSMFSDYGMLGAGLVDLLACPWLQSVTIETSRGFWRHLDDEPKLALEELQRRLKGGLKVRMEGSGYSRGLENLL